MAARWYSRSRSLVFACILAIALPALGAPGGCKYECRRGADFAHCVEYFFGSWYLSECRELQLCWNMWVVDDEGNLYLVRECDAPDCIGSQCFMV